MRPWTLEACGQRSWKIRRQLQLQAQGPGVSLQRSPCHWPVDHVTQAALPMSTFAMSPVKTADQSLTPSYRKWLWTCKQAKHDCRGNVLKSSIKVVLLVMKMPMDHGDGEGGAGSALDDHIDQSILISCC